MSFPVLDCNLLNLKTRSFLTVSLSFLLNELEFLDQNKIEIRCHKNKTKRPMLQGEISNKF